MLFPVLLGGCSLPGYRPADSDAREFVDAQINRNQPLIELAQKNLQLASAIASPFRSPPVASHPGVKPVTPYSTDRLHGLPNIISSGSPEPFTLVSVWQQNLQLKPMLTSIVPPGWSVIIAADLKRDFRQPISLAANDQWPYVLNDLLQQHGWVALIDWPIKEVSVAYRTPAFTTAPSGESRALPQPVSKITTQPVGMPLTAKTGGTVPVSPRPPFTQSRVVGDKVATTSVKQSPPSTTPSVIPAPMPAPKIWRIESGTTLKATIFHWAASERCNTPGVNHWTVAWLTPVNYRIDAPLRFTGDFRAALNGLFTLYGSAKVPLYAGVRSAQCVISIDDKEIR